MKPEKDFRIQQIRAARKQTDPDNLIRDLLSGDHKALSKAITITESAVESDRKIAGYILNQIMPHTGKSLRIGITGLPGAGKSTFIEAVGNQLVQKGNKIAVLAIDPSSEIGKGSILGDRTRMPRLSSSEKAFIRPSPSSGVLGGVAARTRESILLCEAAGFDVILVETVGVGQSETDVKGMTDLFVLLLIAGGGDELQGIKRGIMELADIVLISKADGDNLERAKRSRQEIGRALHLFPAHLSGWTPQSLTCSAFDEQSIEKVWATVIQYFQTVKGKGYFESNRKNQMLSWFKEQVNQEILSVFYADPRNSALVHQLEQQIRDENLPVRKAIEMLFDKNK